MKDIKHNIQKSIIKPDKDRLWKNIEPYLPTDEPYREINRRSLLKGLTNLPVIYPKRDIWDNMEIRINPVPKPKLKIYLKYVAGIAASVIILFAFQTIFFNKPDNNDSANNIINNADNDIEVFLANLCIDNPQKCKSPDFLELKNEILTLQDEKSEIYDQVFYNMNDQNIKKIMDKIDEQIIFLKKQIKVYVSL